ncbi:hypothetical protein O3P69_020321 [Scylla paramamosain]|uniref:Uncharacterized protein n=1 Tax=Scylla paramamosain TaxID=85552 RepID=A0AAW0SKH4_SCYPA
MLTHTGERKCSSVLKVGTRYTREQYSKTVAQSFLVRLMRLSMSSDAEVRLTVQHILHTLLHRHHNAHYLPKPTLYITVSLSIIVETVISNSCSMPLTLRGLLADVEGLEWMDGVEVNTRGGECTKSDEAESLP